MTAFNLSLSPLQSEYVAKPGATIIQAYEITNNSDQTITLNTSVESWQPNGSDGDVKYFSPSQDQIQFSFANANIQLGDTFVLRPSDHRQLVLKIKIPTDARLSDSYYTFFVNKLPVNFDSDTSQSQVLAKLGSHLLLSVSDKQSTSVKANISDFRTIPLIKDIFFTPITLQAQVNNNSSYFFKTFGQLKITKNNRELKNITLEPLNVLSNHSRTIETTMDPPFWPGVYKASLSLDATASAATSSINFYVFPISPILALIFITLILFFLKKLIFKKN